MGIVRRRTSASAGHRPRYAWTSSFTKFDLGTTANQRPATSDEHGCDTPLTTNQTAPLLKYYGIISGPKSQTKAHLDVVPLNCTDSELDLVEFRLQWTSAKDRKRNFPTAGIPLNFSAFTAVYDIHLTDDQLRSSISLRLVIYGNRVGTPYRPVSKSTH